MIIRGRNRKDEKMGKKLKFGMRWCMREHILPFWHAYFFMAVDSFPFSCCWGKEDLASSQHKSFPSFQQLLIHVPFNISQFSSPFPFSFLITPKPTSPYPTTEIISILTWVSPERFSDFWMH